MTAFRRSVFLPVLAVLPVLAPVLPAAAAGDDAGARVKQAAIAPQFLRYVEDPAAGGRLETADVTYKNDKGETVCLVSAVHIGERSYFDGLNESFKKYDAVLYELVKPKGDGVPRPGEAPAAGGDGPNAGIRDVQRLMKDTLGLEFQLDRVDYTPKNFVHADLDAETFERMQAERGESIATLMLQGFMKSMTDQRAGGDNPPAALEDPEQALRDIVRTFTRPDSERQLKQMLAKQMVEMDGSLAGLGPDDNSVILTERNKAAMKVVESTLKSGQRNLAVFYGAAHMPDLENRLAALGFEKVATEWRLAWDLKIRADQPSAVEGLLMDALDTLLDEGLGAGEEPAGGEPFVEAE